MSLLVGASNGGKSALAIHQCVHAAPKIPTLYLSCDTDKVTLGTRIAASVTNETVDDMEERLRAGDQETWGLVSRSTDHIWFYWDREPSCRDIKEETEAYAYEVGDWPHLIVVDNLINVNAEGAAGHEQKNAVMLWLAQLAHVTNAHVMVLHHAGKEYANGTIPIPKTGILDAVDKHPRLVLTTYRMSDDMMGVCVVKNSSGYAKGDASWGPTLGVMFERSWMKG